MCFHNEWKENDLICGIDVAKNLFIGGIVEMHDNIVRLVRKQTLIERFKDELLILLDKKQRSKWSDVGFELMEMMSEEKFPLEFYTDTLSLLDKLARLDFGNIKKLPTRIVYLVEFLIDVADLFLEPATADNFITLAEMGVEFEYSKRYDEDTLIEVIDKIKSSNLSTHVKIWLGIAMTETTSMVKLYAIKNCLLNMEDRFYFYETCCFYSIGDDDVISAAIDGIIALQDKCDFFQINSVYLKILEFLPYTSNCYGKIIKRIRFKSVDSYYKFFKELIRDKDISMAAKHAIKERLATDEEKIANIGNDLKGETDEMHVALRRLNFILINYMM